MYISSPVVRLVSFHIHGCNLLHLLYVRNLHGDCDVSTVKAQDYMYCSFWLFLSSELLLPLLRDVPKWIRLKSAGTAWQALFSKSNTVFFSQ